MSVIFIIAIGVNVQWYCIMILIHISLTTNDADYFTIRVFIGDLICIFMIENNIFFERCLRQQTWIENSD